MKRKRILYLAPWEGTGRHCVSFMGGGFPENQTTETTAKLDPVVAREIGPFADYFRREIRDRPFASYRPGDLVAPFNPDQRAAFDLGRKGSGAQGQYGALLSQGRFQGGITGSETDADAYLRRVLGGSVTPQENAADTFLGSFYDLRQNPYFEEQLGIGRKRIGEEYEESIAPGLAGKYALAGAFGGTAASEAEGRAQRALGRALGEYETGARSAEQERRYAQGLQAAGLTEQAAGRRIGQGLQASGLIESTAARRAQDALADAQLRSSIIGQQENAFQNDFTRLLGIGQQQQDRQQQIRDARYQQFLRRENYPRETFQLYRDAIAALTGAAPAGQTAVTTGGPGGPGVAQQAIGAATTAAALYALYSAATASSAAAVAPAAAVAVCWVAREVFGVNDIRWMLFRTWLTCRAPGWFLNMYVRHGERFAMFLRRNTWLKPVIRRWMEKRIAGLGARPLSGKYVNIQT